MSSAILPAQFIDSAGRPRVDRRAVLALALPLMANSMIQIVLSLTDMWFIGHISTRALAAVGAVQLLIIVIVLVLGGMVTAVQTVVSQACGARRYRRASQAVWTALWITLAASVPFAAVGASSHLILRTFGFDPQIERLAAEFWFPRICGAWWGVAVGAMWGFFNGIGRPRVTLLVTIVTAIANVLFNDLYIFQLGWGIAGSGWATATAEICGLALALGFFLSPANRRTYGSHLTWRPHARRILEQVRLGLPMGLLPAADLLGLSIFQMMQVRSGTAGGAAAQLVMILTCIAYMPGFGIAAAGTTLVGKSIGAGDREWALHIGTRVILLVMLYMGGVGVLLAAAGPWIVPFFTGVQDAEAAATVLLCVRILWIAAGYQLFDGLRIGSAMCLRGAGDATVPAALVVPVAWLVFIPLAHSFTFRAGQGWVDFLPQFGWGAIGGWVAVLIYFMLLGIVLFTRWRSRAWQRIKI